MSADPASDKRRLRRILSGRRRAVPPAEAASAARRIASRLLAEPALRSARRVALYAALADEVPSRPLFDALVALRIPCLFPRVLEQHALAFAAVEDWSELAPGRYGVLEPPAQAAVTRPEEGDLVLVPGVAFDRAGNRLGRGQGCYDRAFPVLAPRPPLLIGVAYQLQLVDTVPHTGTDRRMDAVVTEQALLWAAGATP
ncbi:MAG TPA: 5-formyltetrahydrofolate cyclo-ligase [Myxococcota bacterium]|jgi:5-formyltetrahydrofolate cyclo-ligase